MQTIVSIPGIHCASCAELIKDVSSDFPEIAKVDVNIDAKTVTLNAENGFDIDPWKKEIEALGDTYAVVSVS